MKKTPDFSEEIHTNRTPTHPIHPLLLNRWSSRAMSPVKMEEEEWLPLFEAARWAPSSYNDQPWRFLYAKRDSSFWPLFSNLLLESNQRWAKNASVLVVLISHKVFEKNGKPSKTHQFDAGAAWENLALEGASRNYVVHGMQGFDYEKARLSLKIPDDYQVEIMIAIGKKGKPDDLPEDLQAKETPSSRKPLKELIKEGPFTAQKKSSKSF